VRTPAGSPGSAGSSAGAVTPMARPRRWTARSHRFPRGPNTLRCPCRRLRRVLGLQQLRPGHTAGGTFTQVSAGGQLNFGEHTCGVKSDGTVACWGANSSGQATPPGGTFTQISAGGFHNCAVRADGAVACWGDNTEGQAAPPGGIFTQASAGNFHTCGLRSDGTIACWGDNTEGQATPPGGTFTRIAAGATTRAGSAATGRSRAGLRLQWSGHAARRHVHPDLGRGPPHVWASR
jgi:hypothetical protein